MNSHIVDNQIDLSPLAVCGLGYEISVIADNEAETQSSNYCNNC